MTIGTPPTRDGVRIGAGFWSWTESWRGWFTQVFLALFGWKTTLTATLTHDFGSVNNHSQATTTVTVTGARTGDLVKVTAATPTNNIIVDGYVSADDTVTIRAHNYTAGSVDPASSAYRVIVFQQ